MVISWTLSSFTRDIIYATHIKCMIKIFEKKNQNWRCRRPWDPFRRKSGRKTVVIIITDRVQSDRIEGNRIKNAYKRLLNTIFLRVHLGTRISGAFECVCQSCDVMTFTDEGGHEPVQCVPTPSSLAACLRTL